MRAPSSGHQHRRPAQWRKDRRGEKQTISAGIDLGTRAAIEYLVSPVGRPLRRLHAPSGVSNTTAIISPVDMVSLHL